MLSRVKLAAICLAGVAITLGGGVQAKRTLYVAVCTETQEHGGVEIALGPQRSTYDAANQDGKAHEQATRGHRWRVVNN